MSENYQEVVDDDKQRELNEKVQLWRSMSLGYSEVNNDEFPIKGGSICNGSMANGSMVNGSELCSDVGPSASIVAAEIAAKRYQQLLSTVQPEPRQKVETKKSKEMEDGESSLILEDLTAEEAYAKGLLSSNREKLRKEAIATQTQAINGGHARRNSDGGGLFSCFGNAYGIEFRIVCGANSNNNDNNNNNNNVGNSSRIPNNSNKGRKKWSSETNSA
uniref:Putative ovule protein n=1 Tax=Solanum chacoense TaxID=4108 RepID=A0A0V0HI37_SOLCH